MTKIQITYDGTSCQLDAGVCDKANLLLALTIALGGVMWEAKNSKISNAQAASEIAKIIRTYMDEMDAECQC